MSNKIIQHVPGFIRLIHTANPLSDDKSWATWVNVRHIVTIDEDKGRALVTMANNEQERNGEYDFCSIHTADEVAEAIRLASTRTVFTGGGYV